MTTTPVVVVHAQLVGQHEVVVRPGGTASEVIEFLIQEYIDEGF